MAVQDQVPYNNSNNLHRPDRISFFSGHQMKKNWNEILACIYYHNRTLSVNSM